jgi:hypothetical protein
LSFLHNYVERCQMLSDNQSRLHLNSCSSTCSPHILFWYLELIIAPFTSRVLSFLLRW